MTAIRTFGLVLLVCFAAEARQFQNAYVSFEINDRWKCNLEQTEWVCRSETGNESREAIIVLTAKQSGPVDTFDAYSNHLNTPQTNKARPGAAPSKVVYPAKQNRINDQTWIDGLHIGSEVPNYYTRYLATIKDGIAILVTFSAHKNFYTKYSQDFFKSVASLRVIATKNLLASPEMGPLRPGSETLGAPIQAVMPADMEGLPEGEDEGDEGSGKTKAMLLGLGLVLLGLGAYVYLKVSKKA